MDGVWSTAIICLVLVLICVLGVRSYLKKLHTGCCGSGDEPVKRIGPQDRNPSHYPYGKVLQIEGMHCQNCAARVENAFHREEGVLARVQLGKGKAVVLSKREIPDATLKETVRCLGYRVVEIHQGRA